MNKFTLQIIAMITMTIDHIGMIFFSVNSPIGMVLRIIGRISFPLFALFIAEGFLHSKNLKKYLFRLLSIGLIIEIFYFLVVIFLDVTIKESLNVFIILFFGLFTLTCLKNKNLFIKLLGFLPILFLLLPVIYAKYIYLFDVKVSLRIEYGFYGYFMIVFFGLFKNKYMRVLLLIFLTFLFTQYGILSNIKELNVYIITSVQYYSLLAIPFILLYNGKLGIKIPKLITYWYYPLHLLFLYMIFIII